MKSNTTQVQFAKMRSELRLERRKRRFGERVIRDLATFDMHNRDITNVYWMECRRLDALHKRRKLK